MRALEPWHLAILAVVFIALFGAKRLPDSARSLGEAMHIFKKSVNEHTEPPIPTVPPPTIHLDPPPTSNASAPPPAEVPSSSGRAGY